MKNVVLWDVAPCRYCINRRSFETSVYTIYTRRHIPEDDILRNNAGLKKLSQALSEHTCTSDSSAFLNAVPFKLCTQL
jgi:hypothetical protein